MDESMDEPIPLIPGKPISKKRRKYNQQDRQYGQAGQQLEKINEPIKSDFFDQPQVQKQINSSMLPQNSISHLNRAIKQLKKLDVHTFLRHHIMYNFEQLKQRGKNNQIFHILQKSVVQKIGKQFTGKKSVRAIKTIPSTVLKKKNIDLAINLKGIDQYFIGERVLKEDQYYFTTKCVFGSNDSLLLPLLLLTDITLFPQIMWDGLSNITTSPFILKFPSTPSWIRVSESQRCCMTVDTYNGKRFFGLRMYQYYDNKLQPTKNGFNLQLDQFLQLLKNIRAERMKN